jgi:outer membrane protein assembly factor BamB
MRISVTKSVTLLLVLAFLIASCMIIAKPANANSKVQTPDSITQLWKFPTNGSMYASPVVAGGHIYVESLKNVSNSFTTTVYCIDSSNGNQIWNYQPELVSFSPVVDGSHVYVVDRIYTPSTKSAVTVLYALNATTGVKEWNYTSEYTLFPPVVAGGTVYIQSTSTPGSGEFIIHALDSSMGTEIWNYKTVGGSNSFVIDNGCVFIGSSENVYAVDAFTGTKLWNFTIDSHGVGAIVNNVAAGQLLYIGTSGPDFYALDPSTGIKVWNFTTEKPGSSSVAVGSYVYVRSDINLYALDASTGAIKWTSKFEDYGNGNPVFSNPYIFYSSGKKLYCLDSSTGERKWAYPTEGYAPFVVAGSRVYVGSNGPQFLASSVYHNFSVLDGFTGERLWNYTIEGYASSISVVGKRVYVGSAFSSTENQGQEGSGALYALETPLLSSPSPTSLSSLHLVVTAVVLVFVGICLLIYFEKRKR